MIQLENVQWSVRGNKNTIWDTALDPLYNNKYIQKISEEKVIWKTDKVPKMDFFSFSKLIYHSLILCPFIYKILFILGKKSHLENRWN